MDPKWDGTERRTLQPREQAEQRQAAMQPACVKVVRVNGMRLPE